MLFALVCLNSCNTGHIAGFGMGNSLPAIALPNEHGDTINLDQFAGKVVLIDIWASWCGPCRRENKEMPGLYRDFKKHVDRGDLVFVHISIDARYDHWVEAVKHDNLTWEHQLIDQRADKAPWFKDFGLDRIPQVFIVNKKGIIVANPLNKNEVRRTLRSLLR